VLLGTTAAISKMNLMNWIDNLFTSAAGEECFEATRDLFQPKFKRICKSGCQVNSCGSFMMVIPGRRGNISHQAMCIGPFKN